MAHTNYAALFNIILQLKRKGNPFNVQMCKYADVQIIFLMAMFTILFIIEK